MSAYAIVNTNHNPDDDGYLVMFPLCKRCADNETHYDSNYAARPIVATTHRRLERCDCGRFVTGKPKTRIYDGYAGNNYDYAEESL